MAKKTRLGLGLFFNNTTNSGIVNYIYNIIAALNSLPEELKPEILLYHNETAEITLIKQIEYKNLKFKIIRKHHDNLIIRKLYSLTIKLKIVSEYFFYPTTSFYPYFPFINTELKYIPNKIEWLVDFNNLAFPEYYKDRGNAMKSYQLELTRKDSRIVLSSNALLEELKCYYPNYKNEVKILRFACSLPEIDSLDLNQIKSNYEIDCDFFMSPNQFWEHKNQIVVLKAIYEIKKTNPALKFKVLFTGSLEVNRGKGQYANQLIEMIKEFNISEYVKFLGVLDRSVQLLLMKNSVALIQPSLYEGWSTLVEEAKALNKFIILSDLIVHREQISKNCSFFKSNDIKSLSEIMIKSLKSKPNIIKENYSNNILNFGYDILDALIIK